MITHNPKVAGSNPAPATTETPCLQDSYQVGQRFLQGATHRPPCGHPRPPCGHPSATQRPPPATDRPPPATDRPPPATDRPPCGHQRPPIGHPAATQRPPAATLRPPIGHQRPPRPATPGHRPELLPNGCELELEAATSTRLSPIETPATSRSSRQRPDTPGRARRCAPGGHPAATRRPPGGNFGLIVSPGVDRSQPLLARPMTQSSTFRS